MERIEISTKNLQRPDIERIVDYLRRGKVVALPTDTIYGLHALASDKRAVSRIRRMKKSSRDKPLLILVSTIAMAKRYSRISASQSVFLRKIWPGPITVILAKRRPYLPASGKDSIACRWPKNRIITKIIKNLKRPLVSTSLNLSGRKALSDVKTIDNYFTANKPDLVVDAGKIPRRRPSKIIDIRDLNQIKIIR